jgi:hypothetical protein
MAANDYERRPSSRGDKFNPGNPYQRRVARLNQTLLAEPGISTTARIYGWNQTDQIWEPRSVEVMNEQNERVTMDDNVEVRAALPVYDNVIAGTMVLLDFFEGGWWITAIECVPNVFES